VKKNKKETRGRKRGKYFISNEELVKELKIFYDDDIFTEKLGQHIKLIVDGVAHMPNFINYFKEDNPWGVEMFSEAMWRITKSVFDKNCKIVSEDNIGDVERDINGNIIYEFDDDGEYMLDEDGNKVEKLITQNNIHSYFTRTARNAFIGRINKEKKIESDLNDYKEKIFEDYENEYGIAHQDENEFKDENDW